MEYQVLSFWRCSSARMAERFLQLPIGWQDRKGDIDWVNYM